MRLLLEYKCCLSYSSMSFGCEPEDLRMRERSDVNKEEVRVESGLILVTGLPERTTTPAIGSIFRSWK